MVKVGVLHFHPERVAQIGAGALGFAFLMICPWIWMLCFADSSWILPLPGKVVRSAGAPLSFSLGLSEKGPVLPIFEPQGEMTLSFDPPRPEAGAVEGKRLLVRMKKSGDSRRVLLPCRIDLEFQGDLLKFTGEGSPFWVELAACGNGQIEGQAFISSLEGGKIGAGHFTIAGQEPPCRLAQEFAEGSAFRSLAEARWWGRDQFLSAAYVRGESKQGAERLEVSSGELLDLKEGDWLAWKGQKWQKGAFIESDVPMARIQSVSAKGLVLEGWDADGYVRIALSAASIPPFKMRGEDLFSAIRVRSEKQISCMLEKQCMILKTGDWVMKAGSRWKVLRKKEERDAFVHGKLLGDLFVFEQIVQKQGQKVIQGRLFNVGRTQVVNVEIGAQSARREKKGKAS